MGFKIGDRVKLCGNCCMGGSICEVVGVETNFLTLNLNGVIIQADINNVKHFEEKKEKIEIYEDKATEECPIRLRLSFGLSIDPRKIVLYRWVIGGLIAHLDLNLMKKKELRFQISSYNKFLY